MANSLEPHIPPTSRTSSEDAVRVESSSTPESDEKQRRHHTPKIVMVDPFDGETRVVKAHSVQKLRLTRSLLTFMLHSVVLLLVAIAGLTMAIIRGYGTPEFSFWISMFTLAVGGFIPEPKVKKEDGSRANVVSLATG